MGGRRGDGTSKRPRTDKRRARSHTRSRSGSDNTPRKRAHRRPASRPPARTLGRSEEGHYVVRSGDVLNGYTVTEKLGEGTFAQVVRCRAPDGSTVAVKVIKDVRKYRDSAKEERRILDELNRYTGREPGAVQCVQLLDHFVCEGHYCLVFPLMGPSVYDVIKKNNYKGFAVEHIRTIAKDLLQGLAYCHRMTLTHTDLKPENMLFVNPETTKRRGGGLTPASHHVAVIDFGSAVWRDQHHTSVVCTRQYRPPEVLLELGWSYPCDVWSIGCIVAELARGDALFQTHDSVEHLALMEAILGPIPRDMVQDIRSHSLSRYFTSSDRLRWPDLAEDEESRRFVRKCPTLKHMLSPIDPDLYDLARRMLRFHPENRISCKAALEHPFITGKGD